MGTAAGIPEFPSLRRSERDQAVALIRGWRDKRRGGVTFLIGPPGSGRTRLLTDIREALEQVGGGRRVIAGNLSTGVFRASGLSPAERRCLIDVGEDIGKLVRLVLRLCNLPVNVEELLGLILERSAAALRLAEKIAAAGEDDPAVVPRLLMQAATSDDVTLLLDNLDGDGAGWCSHILHELAPAAAEGLRLTVVATGNGPAKPPAPGDLPDFLNLASELMRGSDLGGHERAAAWFPLGRVDPLDLATAVGCETSVAAHLWDASGGLLGVAEPLWNDWSEQGLLVRDSPNDVIKLAPDAERLTQPAVYRQALRRIRDLLKDNDTVSEPEVTEVLHVAALEGERFTADAVARVRGRDVSEICDTLDRHLVIDGGHTDRFLHRLEPEAVTDGDGVLRELRPYRFAGPILWLAFRNNGLMPERRREYARLMRDVLQKLYGDSPRVHRRLVVLDALVEDPTAALNWQAKVERGQDCRVLRWRAHMVLTADQSTWDTPYRSHAARLLVEAFRRCRSIPPPELRSIVDEAVRLARLATDDLTEARAREASASLAMTERRLDFALSEGETALTLFDALGRRQEAAHTAVMLARIHPQRFTAPQGTHAADETRQTMQSLLERAKRDGDGFTAGAALNDLAFMAGPSNPEAPRMFREALNLIPEHGQGYAERARVLRRLAYFSELRGDRVGAQRLLGEAVAMAERSRLPEDLASVLHVLAAVDIALGSFDSAAEHAARAVEVADAAGSPLLAIAARSGLAAAAAFRGKQYEGSKYLDEAARIADGPVWPVPAVRALLPEIARARSAGLVGHEYATDPNSVQCRCEEAIFLIG